MMTSTQNHRGRRQRRRSDDHHLTTEDYERPTGENRPCETGGPPEAGCARGHLPYRTRPAPINGGPRVPQRPPTKPVFRTTPRRTNRIELVDEVVEKSNEFTWDRLLTGRSSN